MRVHAGHPLRSCTPLNATHVLPSLLTLSVPPAAAHFSHALSRSLTLFITLTFTLTSRNSTLSPRALTYGTGFMHMATMTKLKPDSIIYYRYSEERGGKKEKELKGGSQIALTAGLRGERREERERSGGNCFCHLFFLFFFYAYFPCSAQHAELVTQLKMYGVMRCGSKHSQRMYK